MEFLFKSSKRGARQEQAVLCRDERTLLDAGLLGQEADRIVASCLNKPVTIRWDIIGCHHFMLIRKSI